ncbi:MAG: hypothetical protein IJI42_11535, partial [Methanobrevibacter sp.]|nr:hypothetical protein [Methanobrevibacter sp.]
MRYKKLMMLAIFLVSLLAVSAVSAADNAADDVVSVEKTTTDAVKETTDEIPSVENDENGNILKKTSEENNTLTQTNNAETDSQILSEGEGTYSDLRDEIGSGGDINLTKRYYRYDGGDSIHISNPGVINGNGAVIDMNMSVRAFSVETSGVTFKNLTIKNGNSNGDSGGAICFMDFAIYGTVINCNFTGNSAYSGGAIWMNSGSVENCNFAGNSADCGGAVYLLNTCNVTNCNFTGNNVSSFGGAVHFFSTGSASNCNFTDNEAYYGGAVYFEGTGNVTNCNFADNSAYQGGAIFSQRQYTSVDTCIFKGNSGEDFNIVIYPPALNVDNFTTFYGSGEKLTFNLTTDSGMPVNNGNISISVYFKENGEWVGNYSCLSGEGWTVSLPVGSYYANFTTEYAGFQAINRTITITIPDVRYYINVTSITTNNKTVNITAKTNIPKDMIWDGKLLFILPNGDKIDANYGGYGLWWAEHTFDNYTTYQVNAEYVGLDHVNVSNAIINITRADSKITLDNITLDYGEIKNVTVETVGATKITASINGTNVTVLNNFTIQISDLSIGNHTLTVTTVPDYDHNPVTETAKITVNKAHTEITVDSETVDMKVSDEVPSGATLTPADAGNLTYKSSNETVVIVEDDKIKALGKGNATITVSFAGNENYTAAENMTITVNVDWADASVSVNNSTLDLVADDNFTIVATTDPAGLNVTFVPDDSGVCSVDENGVVTALKEGTATISVKVGGDGVYVENSTTVTVTVSKIPTEIKINRPWREMYVGVMGHVAAELLPSEVGNLSYVSNDTSVVTVSSTGIINANGAGTALITISFNGTDKYAASSSSVNVLVNKAPTEIGANDLELTFGDKSKLVYALAPENAEGNISFVSSNPDVINVSSSGEITAVSVGTANVTITFSGNENYEKSNKTVKVKVAKANSTVRIGPSILDYGNSLNVTADTTGAEGITAKINDQEVKVDGFTIEIPVLDAGKYTLTVTTIPEKNYNAVTENATITIRKINSTLTVNDITFDYKSKGTTTATFTGATGITAEVINQPKAIVNVDGNKITVSNLNVGTYTLSVTTIPDDNHNPVTKTAKITVNKLD